MNETSPIVEGLQLIHKIITRGLSISIRKCDEYQGKEGVPPGEAAGFSMYVSTLKRVMHAHHLSEDEIAFPWFKDHLEAPYDRLKNDHQTIATLLEKIDQWLPDISSDGLVKLREVLGEIDKVWIPHIRTEEENFTVEKVHSAAGMKEQENIVEKLAAHGRQNAGPGPLAVPFMIYNLESGDRDVFMMSFPWIVKRVLVPFVWKAQWKQMSPFLLLVKTEN